jgi:hypothetical protein
MALLERLTGIGYDPGQGVPIAPDTFFAALRDRFRGGMSNAQVVAAFGLTNEDVDDLRKVVRRIRSNTYAYEEPPDGEAAFGKINEMADVIALAGTAPYTTLNAIRNRLIEP